jgi:VanZ family protein
LKYWLPAILWMCLIFSASGDTQSAPRSSRLIEPLVRWLFPQLTDQAVGFIVLLVRKCAHLTEYAVLALLLWRAIRKPVRNDSRPWCWSHVAFVVGAAFLYAASDEFHQRFVPNREGRFHDVLIDTAGAALGLLALWLFGKWRQRRRKPNSFTATSTPEIAP